MKFHLTIDNGKTSVCGITASPDKFLYNKVGFTSHLAKDHRCKKCEKKLKELKSDPSTQKN